jgi:hypothetical protein
MFKIPFLLKWANYLLIYVSMLLFTICKAKLKWFLMVQIQRK